MNLITHLLKTIKIIIRKAGTLQLIKENSKLFKFYQIVTIINQFDFI